MDTTSGLVSAYQLVATSARMTEEHNLSVTNDERLSVTLVPLKDFDESRQQELIKIRVTPAHDQLAFAILVKRTFVEVLPGGILTISREALNFLDEAGIIYEVVG